MSLTAWLSLMYGIGYVLFVSLGFLEDDPTKRIYNRLLSTRLYSIHLAINAIIAAAGIYRVLIGNHREIWAISPFLFLLLLHPINFLVRAGTGRNIMIFARGDKIPPHYSFLYDGMLGIVLIVVPIILPGYLMNKLNSGNFFI
jgi:hypothetical protein